MMQLQDILFSQGFGTRRVCCGLVQQGLVQLGEQRQVCEDPAKVVDEQGLVFWVQGERWEYHALAYLLLHKPAGTECSQKPSTYPSIYTLLPAPLRSEGDYRLYSEADVHRHGRRRLHPFPDFGGNLDVSNMGGQSALVAQSCGFAGTIVNGAVRDLPAIHEIDYPIWAAGVTPITGKFRMEAMEMNGPVTVHDIVVYPGDLVVADDSGICVVPQDLVVKLIDEAETVGGAEDRMRDLIRSKAPISELKPLFRKRYDS